MVCCTSYLLCASKNNPIQHLKLFFYTDYMIEGAVADFRQRTPDRYTDGPINMVMRPTIPLAFFSVPKLVYLFCSQTQFTIRACLLFRAYGVVGDATFCYHHCKYVLEEIFCFFFCPYTLSRLVELGWLVFTSVYSDCFTVELLIYSSHLTAHYVSRVRSYLSRTTSLLFLLALT